MSNSHVTLVEQLTQEINRIGTMNRRILSDKYRNSLDTGTFREAIVASKVDIFLSIPKWNKVLSSKMLENLFANLPFSGDVLETLLEYPHYNEVTAEEWKLLFKHNNELNELLNKESQPIFGTWVLPLTLQAMKMQNDFFVNLDSIVYSFVAEYDLQGRNLIATKNHAITMKLLSLSAEKEVSYALLPTLEKLSAKEDNQSYFYEICDLLVLYANEVVTINQLEMFSKGLKMISEIIPLEQRKELQRIMGTNFAKALIEIGSHVKTALTEKAINQLFHKEGDTLEILFHPYGEQVRDITNNAKGRLGEYRFGHFYPDYTNDKIIAFAQYLALHKKKAFFRLLKESEFDLHRIMKDSLLVEPDFYRLVNVNTLNHNTLLKAAKTALQNDHFKKMDVPMTLQEFELLNNNGIFHNEMFLLMKDLKVDTRIRLLGMLPNLNYKSEYLLSFEEFKKILFAAMQEKGFQNYTNLMKTHNLSQKGALFLHLFSDAWESFKNDINSDQDVELLMVNQPIENETLLGMKSRLYDKLLLITEFKSYLGASDEFIQTNRNRFYHFYEKGLMSAVMSYKNTLTNKQEHNLRLLCKAEIAGKLKDVKFRDEDFAKEIGITPTSTQRAAWKNDLAMTEHGLTTTETNDFFDLFNFGVIPTETCQSWRDGSYKHCLLSIFDLNKKIIVIKQGEKVVARAILRLTKMKLKEVKKEKLGFVDIENDSLTPSSIEIDGPNEKIVMFLERFYTTHTGAVRIQMIKNIIALAEEKAKDMNIELLYANSYGEMKPKASNVSLQLFISRSKNGNQYLDSLGGEATDESGGNYHHASVLRLV